MESMITTTYTLWYINDKFVSETFIPGFTSIHICDVIKQNESEVENFCFFVFWLFLLGYYLSFNLVKNLWRLGNWFSRNSILSDWKNNEKQNKLLALFSYIFE